MLLHFVELWLQSLNSQAVLIKTGKSENKLVSVVKGVKSLHSLLSSRDRAGRDLPLLPLLGIPRPAEPPPGSPCSVFSVQTGIGSLFSEVPPEYLEDFRNGFSEG